MGPRTPAGSSVAAVSIISRRSLAQNWSAFLTFSSSSTLTVTSPGRLVEYVFCLRTSGNLKMCSSSFLVTCCSTCSEVAPG